MPRAVAAALALVPKSPRPDRAGRSLDLTGGLTITAAILLLVVGVERAGRTSLAGTLGTLGAGLAALAVFVAVERRAAVPLVRLGIFRSGALVRANAAGLLFAAGFFGFQFLVVLYLQELRGWSTLETSFAMIVIGVDAVLSPTLVPRLVARFGHARLITGGLLLASLSYAAFLPVGADWTYAAMLPSLLLLGVAFALAYGPLTIVATEGVKEEEQGLAGGLLYTSFQFGAALGLSAAAAVDVAATTSDSPAALLDGYRAALWVPLVAALLATLVSAFGVRSPRSAGGPVTGGGRRPADDRASGLPTAR